MRRRPPSTVRDLTRGYRRHRITVGESGADAFHLTCSGKPALVLKHCRVQPDLNLRDEGERLRWLSTFGLAPQVVHIASEGGHDWLLMTALPGVSIAEANAPHRVKVELMADALKRLHALPAASCPFDETLDRKIARARRNLAEGRVEEEHFDDDNRGRGAEALFADMLRRRPDGEDIVVTHGDACPPNFMMQDDRFTGFVDCARLGRADRYQDLSLACRSIAYDFGEAWIDVFLERYGVSAVDGERLAFYRLLDEFS